MTVINPQVTSLDKLRNPRVDSIVAAFRAVWAAGDRPRLEDFLAGVADPERPKAFRELLVVELTELRKAGCEPKYEDYAARFPSHGPLVAEQFTAPDSCEVATESTLSLRQAPAGTDDSSAKRRKIESRYRYLELLGRGGFGEVWKARDELLGRDVALKGPRRDRTFSQQLLTAFIDEARKGSQLRQCCDRVVNVIDVEDECGFCFIVMELMKGGSLATRTKAGPMPPADAARIVAEIAEILAKLHSEGFVHRDIKPANVLFDEAGTPHLADLGLAASEEQLLDEPDDALGTLLYMPLEQAECRSNRVDGRADIYSLGVIFYQLLTGRLPHRARKRAEYLKRLTDPDGPKPPRQVDADIPAELERICLRCLQTHARDRYQTAADIARDICRWERKQASKGRRGYLLTAALAAATVALAAVVFFASGVGTDRTSPSAEDTASGAGTSSDGTEAGDRSGSVFHDVRELVFPDDAESTWTPINAGTSIHVTSTNMSLLGLADVDVGGDCTVEVNLHQLDWVGRVGLFLGHRVDEAGNGRFDVIELENWNGAVRWKRSLRRYSGSSPAMSSYGLSEQAVDEPKPGVKQLQIQIRDGMVEEVRFCGERLEQLTIVAPADQGLIEDCSGQIGLYNFKSTASFSDFSFNGQEFLFRKGGD